MEFLELPEFAKEFKKLKKKYQSLDDDFENICQVLKKYPKGLKGKHWNNLKKNESVFVFKTRMRCRALQNTNLRLIYLFTETENRIIFIEIYFKGDKENEDKERIKIILQSL